mgnify:CR=1 FL=1
MSQLYDLQFNKDDVILDIGANDGTLLRYFKITTKSTKVYDKKQITKNEYTSNNKKIKNAPVFLWPAKGEVIKNFGRFGKGQHYDGIDIMFGKNKPIYSAYDGEVAFVGSQIKKFGNLIIVKHDNSWVTAYSNLGNYNVEVGDKLKKQQIIAFTPEITIPSLRRSET